MHLEIVTPEATLFSGEVNSVAVPGVEGEFQMLNNHAATVSLLGPGTVKVWGDVKLDEDVADKFTQGKDGITRLEITSGTVEMSGNKVIVLAD